MTLPLEQREGIGSQASGDPVVVGDYDGITTREVLNQLLTDATQSGASDIKLQAGNPVIAEVGGLQYPMTRRSLTTPDIKLILDQLYGNNSASGIVPSGSPLDGAYDIRTRTGRLRFRYNATACHAPGEQSLWIAMRTIPSVPPLLHEELHIEPVIISRLRPEKGIILVTGVTGSGKTTLLAASMRYLVERPNPSRSETVVTIEKPIEFVYDQVKKNRALVIQHELGRDLKVLSTDAEYGVSPWAHACGNAMRQKPTIIMLGEARDADTYRAVLTAASTGHLVYTTVHTTDVATTIFRMVNEVPPSQQNSFAVGLLSNLQMVVCQGLVAKKGRGRIAVREYLIFTPEIKRQLLALSPERWLQAIRDVLESCPIDIGRRSIDHLREHYANGLIDEDEMARWETEAKLGAIS